MSEFRIPSHNKRYGKKAFNRFVFFALFIAGLIFLGLFYIDEFTPIGELSGAPTITYYPEANQGVIYHKPSFSLSYVERYELPEWVTYELTVDMLNKKKFERHQDFNPDPDIATGSGHYRDYKSSGYRRGHLVPSADMAWKKNAMDATFLLSNVAPMRERFNDGIWLELENNVRDWARRYKGILVVTGPVFSEATTTIGDNEILVPKYFYKAVFTVRDNQPEVIAFLFDQNDESPGALSDYVVSVDSLENLIGIDLFSNLYGDWDEEIKLEKRRGITAGEWPFNERWSNQRMEKQQ
jgi:endonuclease G